MGSGSDLGTMRHAAETLDKLNIHYEIRILSAHRTPDAVHAWSSSARDRGIRVIIAAAGGAAHLAGVVAAKTSLPVLAVPMQSALDGVDSLYSMVQMPGGVPVGCLAIGKPGAINAALLAAQILALSDDAINERLTVYRQEMQKKAAADDEKLVRAQASRTPGQAIDAMLEGAGFKL
jgi:5-(carboxyamino)imidazole ribonucleotide mutase